MTTIRGDRIKELRKALGLSQYDLQDAMMKLGQEVRQSWLSQVESGKAGLRSDAVVALAFVLGTSTDYLLGLTDDATPPEDLEHQVYLVEKDGERREYLQRLFRAVQTLPPDLKREYYDMIEVLYRGLATRTKTGK